MQQWMYYWRSSSPPALTNSSQDESCRAGLINNTFALRLWVRRGRAQGWLHWVRPLCSTLADECFHPSTGGLPERLTAQCSVDEDGCRVTALISCCALQCALPGWQRCRLRRCSARTASTAGVRPSAPPQPHGRAHRPQAPACLLQQPQRTSGAL